MALVNHAKREINAKIVYYGPEMVGKATSVRYVYDRIKPSLRGELKAMPASGSSLLFFDFSPFEQLVLGGYRVRLHIYTLQGRVTNPAAWKMTLKGADGIVIVADASPAESASSSESLLQLREYLGSYGVGLHDIPFVLQLNKKDLSGEVTVEDVTYGLGLNDGQYFFSSAVSGTGVLETLTALSKLIMDQIGKRDDLLQIAPSCTIDKKSQFVSEVEQQAAVIARNDSRNIYDFDMNAAVTGAAINDSKNKILIPTVFLGESGVSVNGTTVKIPLSISKPGGMQRIVVTVDVSLE